MALSQHELQLILSAKDQMSGPLGVVNRALGGLTGIAKTAGGVLIGSLGASAVRSVVNGIGNMASEAFGAVASHERLSMSLQSLAAREMRAADATLTQEDALAQAGERAQELVHWVEQVGIKSPFSSEGVADAMRTAMAYGFTTDEAQRLTQATIDFAAGSGASGAAMNQIALALGQIQAKGKLAGQEVLQLVNAGISVDAILAKAMGKTTAEVVALREKGLIPADQAIDAIVSSLEDDFGGAAEKQSTSLAGLSESLQELKTINLRNLFTGVFKEAQPYISAVVDKLSSPEFQRGVQRVGEHLGKIAGGFLEKAPEMLQGVQRGAAFAFDQLEEFGLLPRPLQQVAGAMGDVLRGQMDFTTFLEIADDRIGQFGEKVGDVWGEVIGLFQGDKLRADTFEPLLEYMGMDPEMADRVSAVLAEVANKVASFVTGVGQLVRGEVPEAFHDLGLKWGEIFQLAVLRKEIGEAFAGAGDIVEMLFGGDIAGALTAAFEAVDWVTVAGTLLDLLGTGAIAALDVLSKITDAIRKFFESDTAINTLTTTGRAIGDLLIDGIDALFDDDATGQGLVETLIANIARNIWSVPALIWKALALGGLEARTGYEFTPEERRTAVTTPLSEPIVPEEWGQQPIDWNVVQERGALPIAGSEWLGERMMEWGQTWRTITDWFNSTFGVNPGQPVPTVSQGKLDEMAVVLDEVQAMPIYGRASGYALVDRSLINPPSVTEPQRAPEREVPPPTRGTGGIGGYATGTLAATGGWHMVGERGPELMRIPTATQIFNTQQTRQMLAQAAQASGGNLTVTIGTINAPSGDVERVREGARLGILSGLREMGVAFNG